MTIDYQTLTVAGVQGMMPYQPGKPVDEWARESGLDPADIVRAAAAYGMPRHLRVSVGLADENRRLLAVLPGPLNLTVDESLHG